MPDMEVSQRAGSFVEVELGLAEEEARREAQRCLRCGLICYQHDPAAQNQMGCQGCTS
jgi:formate dehydrogenase beta subunit